jgi:hypothetical protein
MPQRRVLEAIDKTQVDDVDRDLGIVAGLEGLPDAGLAEFALGLRRGRRLLPEGVGRGAGNPVKASLGMNGVAAPKRLGDLDLGPLGKRRRDAVRNSDGFKVAQRRDGFSQGGHAGKTWRRMFSVSSVQFAVRPPKPKVAGSIPAGRKTQAERSSALQKSFDTERSMSDVPTSASAVRPPIR